jgi:hypothetical protein
MQMKAISEILHKLSIIRFQRRREVKRSRIFCGKVSPDEPLNLQKYLALLGG